MKKKLTELLKYLSSQPKAFTSNELANALQISTRTIKNYVNEINSLYHKKIIFSSRSGYEINPQVSLDVLLSKESDQIPQTWEERAFYIIKQLVLEHTSHLELFELCETLCVSYSSIKSVISKLNKTFSSYHVEFLCEHDCVRLVGEEKDKRKLISYVIAEEFRNSFIDTNQLKNCFSNFDVDELYEIVTSTFRTHDYYLNDFVTVNLLLHLAIIIDREISGNPLNNVESYYDLERDHQEKALIDELCEQMETTFSIQLNKYEKFEVYMLAKATANAALPESKEELGRVVGKELLDLIQYYVAQISSLYLIDLQDDAFITPFALHLHNLLFRARMHRSIQNPMAESIKLNSPVVFDIAIFIGLDLMERYSLSINEDEMAFLAMHIGAEIERQSQNRSKIPAVLLCPEYRDMSNHVFNKLLLNYSNQINIIRSVHSEQEVKELQYYRILFTTIPLVEEYPSIKVVQISPFNLSSSFESIQNTILQEQNEYKNKKLRTNFHTFFEKDLFVADSPMKTSEQIIHCLSEKLKAKHYVEADFEEKILKREHAATTAFANIAIPHSMEMDAIKTCIAVAISKKGFTWGSNTVHLVFLLAINKADKKTFRDLYESLIMIFTEYSILQEVRTCDSFQEFERLVYHSIDAME